MNFSADLQEPVHLGTPTEITIKEVAEEIVSLTGSRSRLEYRPLPADDPRQRCARERLNWQPRVKIELKRLIAFFEGVLARARDQKPGLVGRAT